MNWMRITLGSFVALVGYFVYGFLVNGILLRNDYLPYPAVFRSADQVMKVFPIGIAATFVAIVVIAIVYAGAAKSHSGWVEGLRFGALIGIFVMFAHVAHNYVNLNIGSKLALELAAAVLVQWTIVGLIIGLMYKPIPTTR